MAINIKKGVITAETEILPANLVAQSVKDMRHGDSAYMRKHFLGPSADTKNKRGYPVWINLDGDLLSETDLQTPETEGGVAEEGDWYMKFVRIICVDALEQRKKKKPRKIRGYIVDASHFNFGLENLASHKVEPADWETEEVQIGRVIGFVANPSYWDRVATLLAGKPFKVPDLGRSALIDIRAQSDAEFGDGVKQLA